MSTKTTEIGTIDCNDSCGGRVRILWAPGQWVAETPHGTETPDLPECRTLDEAVKAVVAAYPQPWDLRLVDHAE